MTWDELNAIIQRHGGAISAPVVVDPMIDNPTDDAAERRLEPKVVNPNPTYRYNLKDGKYFTAKAVQTDEGGGATAFQVVDPGSAVQPLTPADRLPSAAQDLVKLDARGNVIPPGDTTTPAAKLRDPSTGAVTDLDPKAAPEGQVKEFGNQLLNIKPDGTYTVIASKPAEGAAAAAKTTFDGPDGARYEYDPNKSAGSRLTKLIDAPPDKSAPTTTKIDGKPFQWDPAAGAWKEAPGLPSETKPATASTNTGARWIVFYDDKGNEVSRQENPNFVPTAPTQLTPDSVSANIPLLRPDGTVTWVPNQNRIPAGQAMQDMLGQLGVAVDGNKLSMDDAKNMLSASVNILNAQSQQQGVARAAAGDILSATQQGAQTGASMLNQRVQAAQGMLGSVLGMAGQGQRSGNMGGGLMSAPAGLGQALVGGIQGWTEQLGGGADVYSAAANLVKRADPTGGNNPQASVAYGVLGQMLEKYQTLTGKPHPLVAQQQQQGAMAPTPAPAPQGFSSPPMAQPQYDPRYQPSWPQQQPGTLLPAGVAGTVPPGDPRFLGPQTAVQPPPVTINIG